jgi:hypothetical protein
MLKRRRHERWINSIGGVTVPIHFHPVLRSLEEAEEAEGLIIALDSVGVTIKKNAEAATPPAGVAPLPKIVPVGYTRIIRGHVYTAT